MRNIGGISSRPLRVRWGVACPLLIEIGRGSLGGGYPSWWGLAHRRGRGLIGIGHVMVVMHIVSCLLCVMLLLLI